MKILKILLSFFNIIFNMGAGSGGPKKMKHNKKISNSNM